MPELDLETVLTEILEAQDAGQGRSPQEWIARYPQFTHDLASFFADQRQFDRIAASVLRLEDRADGDSSHNGSASAGSSSPTRFGDYELLSELGRGGMGVVYLARHTALGRLVALKMVLGGAWAAPVNRERFRVEAELAAQLDHPQIIPIYDVGEWDGQPYFTMKLIDGRPLSDQLDRWKYDPRAAAGLVAKLAHAVHYAHQRGLLHRDLKPSNILLDHVGQPYLTDFGLAKKAGSDHVLTQTGAVVGTPEYMAPEQAAGHSRNVTTAADVYSLGAILYAVLTGQPVFRGTSPAETLRHVVETPPQEPHKVNPHLPRDVETICLKCLEKDPRQRYDSAGSLAEDLERWIGHLPIQARRSGIWQHTVKWARRRPAVAALVTVASVAAITIFAETLWYNARLETEIANVTRSELAARRHSYAAQMNLAYQAWESGHIAHALRLLETQVPRPDELDLRSFEWHHLAHRARRNLHQIIEAGPGPVRGVHFSPDSRRLICGCADGLVRVLDLQSGKVSLWMGHQAPIRATAVSPRGDRLATMDEQGVLNVWNLPGGSRRFSGQGARDLFYTVTTPIAFAADGKSLAVKASLNQMGLLGTDSGQRKGTLGQQGYMVNAVAFAPPGGTVALATNSLGILLLRELAADQVPETLGTPDTRFLQLAMSPDGTTLASSTEDGVVQLWDLERRKEVARFDDHTVAVYSLGFAPDGQSIASGSENGTAKVRDLLSGTVRTFGHSGTVYSLAFSPDGKFMATGDAEGHVRLWDWQTSDRTEELVGHDDVVYSLSFSPDGRTLASGGKDHSIRLWDVETGMQRAAWTGHAGWVTGLAFSPDGSLLVSGNTQPDLPPPKPGDETGVVRLWDPTSQHPLATIEAHEQATWGIAFAPNGQSFATAGYKDKTARIWDAKTRELLATLEGHPQRIWCVTYSPDGRLLATASASDRDDEETVFIWDLESKTVRHRLKVRWVWSVAFSPDGTLLATGSEGGLVKLWNVDTGTETLPLQGHSTAVKCVAFCPDGRILASASADKTIRLWDVVTGDERATLTGHDSPIYSMAFSRDGKTLASGDTGGTIRLWRTSGREEVSGSGKL